ncbi:MAG: signal peptidase I [Clostridiales bacterium]|nr:signal peptidase I [Clostridiales bacterium]
MKAFIRDILIAVAIVAVITIVVKPTIVKESSMEPTLYENNYLLVNKLAYMLSDHPGYGDIIVFHSELEKDYGSGKKMLIKRVIGVEGDTIEIKGYDVYRNGERLKEPYTISLTEGEVESNKEFHMVCSVPKDKLFVMGDNRPVSLDSRSDSVGLIDEKAVLGKAFVRLYPFNEIGGI